MAVVNRNLYFSLFLLILVVILVGSLTFSVFTTGGVTIQWFLLPFIVIGGVELVGRVKGAKLREYALPFIFWAVLFLCFSALFYWISFYSGNADLKVPRGDYVTYARIAAFISYTGVENNTLDYTTINELRVTPYHYFEIWLTSLISTAFGLNIVQTLTLIVLPLFWSLIGLGIAALVQTAKVDRLAVKDFLLIFLLATAGGFAFLMPGFLHVEPYPGGLFNMPKVIPIALVMVTALLAYKLGSKNLFFAAIFLVIAIYTPAAPAVLGGTFLFLLYKYIRNREARAQFFSFAFYLFIAAVCIIAFYKIFGGSTQSHNSFDFMSRIVTGTYWIRVIKIMLGSGFQLLLVLPYVVFAFYVRRLVKADPFLSDSFVWFLLMFISGAFVWALMHPLLDSTQFFSNIAMVLFTLLPSLLGIAVVKMGGADNKSGKRRGFVLAALVGVLLISFISNQFLYYPHRIATAYFKRSEVEVVKNYFKTELSSASKEPVLIGCFFNQTDYSHIFSYNPFFIDQMEFLNSISNKPFAYIHMNPEQIKIQVGAGEAEYLDDMAAAYKAAPFARYVSSRSKAGSTDSSVKSSFMAENEIRYLAFNAKLVKPGLINIKDSALTEAIKIPNKNWYLFEQN